MIYSLLTYNIGDKILALFHKILFYLAMPPFLTISLCPGQVFFNNPQLKLGMWLSFMIMHVSIGATKEDVVEAAKAAKADDFISKLPDR